MNKKAQSKESKHRRWTVEQARAWWKRQRWPVGCNFIPSTAVNQLEMWQADTFDLETIKRELSWAADLGFNVVRVYLHDLLWEQHRDGLRERIDAFLESASHHGIKAVFVIFDDVWNTDPKSGPQPKPHPGRHNSRWLQSPGLTALAAYPGDDRLRERLRNYVEGVIQAFRQDDRVLIWDLYNEPGGLSAPSGVPVGSACLPLLRDVFDWARAVQPSQPLTSGVRTNFAQPIDPSIRATQMEQSDVVSFHHYGNAEALRHILAQLKSETARPLLCTEYMARDLDSRFATHLPIFREADVGAICWGLVSGKTQTIYPWWSWADKQPRPEPETWFHDVLRPDGTPFDEAEAHFLRRFLLK